MGYITKVGSFWGMIPQTSGQVLWVAPSSSYTVEGRTYPASDNNDGLSPERALRTFNQAITNATASAGDVIVGLPGSHSVTTTILVNKAGLTIVGIPGALRSAHMRRAGGSKRLRTQITSTATAGIILTVSAPDTEVAYLHFAPPAAGGQGISLTPTLAAANRAFVHDCTFALQATASTTTYGITVPANVTADILDEALIAGCYFVSGLDTTTGANGPGVNVLGTAHGMTIENSTFELKGTAAWATAILSSNAGTLGLAIRDCDFIAPTSATTVITNVIDTTGQTVDGSTVAYRCYFMTGSTKDLKSTATPDIVASECYSADATAGITATR